LLVLAMLPARPDAAKTHFDRIRVGMNRTEIEAILGEPTFYDTVDLIADWRYHGGTTGRVVFANGVAAQVFWFESAETLADKIRRWLGWREEMRVLEEIN